MDVEMCAVAFLEQQINQSAALTFQVLPSVPKDQRTRVARFLEKQGFKAQAMQVTSDPEHKFELAIALQDIKAAEKLATGMVTQIPLTLFQW